MNEAQYFLRILVHQECISGNVKIEKKQQMIFVLQNRNDVEMV
jgi:hypothetical protein